MKIRFAYKTAALVCCTASLCLAGSAAAQESVVTPAEPETAKLIALGQEAEDALKLTLTNQTGQDICFIKVDVYDPSRDPNEDVVQLQEALIEQGFLQDVADGSFGPKTKAAVEAFRQEKGLPAEGGADEQMLTLLYGTYDDGNLLKDEDLFKSEEARMLYYKVPDKTEEDSAAPSQDVQDPFASVWEEYSYSPAYVVTFRLADEEETEYTLHAFTFDQVAGADLYIEDGIAYIEYTQIGKDELLSTKDIEKAVYDLEHPVYQSYDDDYYYDYSYDDTWYDDTYYDGGNDAQGGDGCIEDGLFW